MKTTTYAVTATAAKRMSLVSGVVLGGLWAWQAGASVWEHAIRFGILLFIVAPVILRVLGHRVDGVRIDAARLLAAKAVLLVAAIAASALLGRVTGGGYADYLVAAGIAVVVALGGPWLLRSAVTPA